jgi:hypothetical protein
MEDTAGEAEATAGSTSDGVDEEEEEEIGALAADAAGAGAGAVPTTTVRDERRGDLPAARACLGDTSAGKLTGGAGMALAFLCDMVVCSRDWRGVVRLVCTVTSELEAGCATRTGTSHSTD